MSAVQRKPSPSYRAPNEVLRQARLERGWTQDVLARNSGVSIPTIGRVERGGASITLATFRALCVALRVSADYVLGLAPDGPSAHPVRKLTRRPPKR